MTALTLPTNRHPGLDPGSISRPAPSVAGARWMLKQVQHDGVFGMRRAGNPHHDHSRHPELVSGSISRFTRWQRFKAQPDGQIGPMRIRRFDQIDLPLSTPVLQLLFTGYRCDHVAVHFKPDQPGNTVRAGEARQRALAVLPQARRQVGRHANVQRAARLAGQNVDAGVAIGRHRADLAPRWTLKQVQGDDAGKAAACR